jgi:hypothetical protein
MKLSALGMLLVANLMTGQKGQNEIFNELVQVGLQIPDGTKLKLPVPLLGPDQAPKIDDELLDKAADKVPTELFLKRSVTAPFALKFDSMGSEVGQRNQVITLRFVAYGKLEALLEGDPIKRLLGGKEKADKGDPKAKTVALSPEELQKRGIRLLDLPNAKETYGTIALSLLDKVQVEGVTRNLRTTSAHSVLYAMRLDERFKNDKEYPNQWRFILNMDDVESLGPPHPYTGLGGYVLVTALPTLQGALLIEMCFLLHEPRDWFEGRNLLRAKLPLLLKDNVTNFRRKLAAKASSPQ